MKDAARLLSFMSTQGEKERSKETLFRSCRRLYIQTFICLRIIFQLPIPFPFLLLLLIRFFQVPPVFLMADGFVVGAVLFCHLILWGQASKNNMAADWREESLGSLL